MVQTRIAAIGAICVAFFLCIPFPISGPMVGGSSDYISTSAFILAGGLDKLIYLLLAPGIVYLVHRQMWGLSLAAGIIFCLVVIAALMWPVFRFSAVSAWPYPVLGVFHWLLLCTGAGLLIAPSVWEMWSRANQPDQNTAPATTANSSPSLQNNLQSAVGYCSDCGTKNPRTLTRCYSCGIVLPWAMPQAKAPLANSRSTQLPLPSRLRTTPAFIDSIDWGFWIVALLSFVFLPVGLILYLVYAADDNPKSKAAGIGLCLALVLIVVHVVVLVVTGAA